MEKKLNLKELLKISCNCGLGVIGLVIVYMLLNYGFNFIAEHWKPTIVPVVIEPVILITKNIIELILTNLKFITISWILLSLWFACIGFKTIDKFKEVPKVLKIIYKVFLPIGIALIFINIFNAHFIYATIAVGLMFFNYDIYKYKEDSDEELYEYCKDNPRIRIKKNKNHNDPQLKFDF